MQHDHDTKGDVRACGRRAGFNVGGHGWMLKKVAQRLSSSSSQFLPARVLYNKEEKTSLTIEPFLGFNTLAEQPLSQSSVSYASLPFGGFLGT